ncbi:hypothetical protein LCGC14_0461520 [marine sediment metagenome]|uniref:Tyr recombinase domain-containing protein n=1 Tax=marine sediment metagenome TaxID=412755 RepID=A0A0F9SK19_9ZZZZ
MPRSKQPFHPRATKLGSGKWVVDCRAWRNFLRSWGCPVRPEFWTEEAALHRVRELDAYYLMGGPPVLQERVSLTELRDLFLASRQADGLSWQTILKYQRETETFVGYAKTRGWRYVDQINTSQFTQFKVNQVALGLALRTVYLQCSIVRAFFSFAEQMGYVTTNPVKGAMPARSTEQANRSLTDEERTTIWEFGGIRSPVWRLMLATGCRRSELCKLASASFEFTAIPHPFVRLNGKGKVRNFPLSPGTVDLAHEFIAVAPTLRGPSAHPIAADSVWAPEYSNTLLGILPIALSGWWLADRGVMGLADDVVMHTLRHDFATSVVARSGVRAAQQLLGHADIRTTVQYDHTSDDILLAAVSEYGAFLSARKTANS